MWIFSKYGFYSVVEKEGDIFHVRARRREDLVSLADAAGMAGELEISSRPMTDYQYRYLVDADQWKTLAGVLFESIDYPNFKNEISIRQHWRANLYARIWSILQQLAERSEAKRWTSP